MPIEDEEDVCFQLVVFLPEFGSKSVFYEVAQAWNRGSSKFESKSTVSRNREDDIFPHWGVLKVPFFTLSFVMKSVLQYKNCKRIVRRDLSKST